MNEYDRGVIDALSWVVYKLNSGYDSMQLKTDILVLSKIKIDELGHDFNNIVEAKMEAILGDIPFHTQSLSAGEKPQH